MAYLTAAIAKSDWLNIGPSDTTHDAIIGRLIAIAEKVVEGVCTQPIEQQAKTMYFNGNGKYFYYLPYSVPVTLTSLASRDYPSDAFAAITDGVITERNGVSILYNGLGFFDNEYKAS